MNQKFVFILFAGLLSVSNGQKCGPTGTESNCPLRCQDETTGAFLPVATICEDTRNDCDVLIGDCTAATPACEDGTAPTAPTAGDPTTNPAVRAWVCDNPSSQDIAMQCAKTCAICCETPEYNCDDDDTGVVDCQANIGKCNDANWTDIMAQYCPASCGLCMAGSCADLNSGCGGMASLCRDIDWYDYMGTNCARTCERCTTDNTTSTTASSGASSTGSSCADIASNCATNANLCTNNIYRTLMQQQCCATCASSSGSGSTCVDSNASCGNWVPNGFCSSSFYTTAQKRQYCARSCNLC